MRAFSDDVARQASHWLVLLASGEASAGDRQRWQAWHDADPQHRQAWQHIEHMHQRLRGLPAGVALSALGTPAAPGRRATLKTLAVVATAGGAGLLAYRHAAWRDWSADLRTATGEQRTLTLADGSRLVLNTRSAVDVVMDSGQRRLRLHAGEILVSTAHGPLPDARPFVVETRHGRVRALGTRFSVRQEDTGTAVALFDGAVEVQPAGGRASPALRLQAGQGVRFDADTVGAPTPVDRRAGAWADGLLVAEGQPLSAFVAELARYRTGHLACDPAVATLRVSGVFRLGDTDEVLAALADALPVRVRYRTRYWATLVPR